jgi:hypothetical protein
LEDIVSHKGRIVNGEIGIYEILEEDTIFHVIAFRISAFFSRARARFSGNGKTANGNGAWL